MQTSRLFTFYSSRDFLSCLRFPSSEGLRIYRRSHWPGWTGRKQQDRLWGVKMTTGELLGWCEVWCIDGGADRTAFFSHVTSMRSALQTHLGGVGVGLYIWPSGWQGVKNTFSVSYTFLSDSHFVTFLHTFCTIQFISSNLDLTFDSLLSLILFMYMLGNTRTSCFFSLNLFFLIIRPLKGKYYTKFTFCSSIQIFTPSKTVSALKKNSAGLWW